MKKFLILAAGLLQFYAVSAQVSLTATVGTTSGSFSTLKSCFDAINAGTHKGVITVSITGNTTETASAALNASGSGSASYTSISISPSGGAARTISGNIAGALINFNGADNVTIDGLNSGGNALTIQNSNTGTSTSTIQFLGDATANTITRATVNGSTTGTMGYGVIYFGYAISGNGNDGNTISSCNVGPAGSNLPFFLIGSAGSSGKDNSGNSVTNCNLYNFYNSAGADAAIYLYSYSTAWTITGNSIYQTSGRNKSSGSSSGIYINAGDGYVITNNYFGGSTASCGSTAMTYTGSATSLRAVEFYVGAATVNKSSINYNIIQNISLTSASTSQSSNSTSPRFSGVYIYTGNADIIGNTIGNSSATGSITITNTGSFSLIYNICVGYAAVAYLGRVDSNTVAGITATASTYNYDFSAFFLDAIESITSFSNNTIGSATVANSISCSGTIRDMFVDYFYGTVPLSPTITGNKIMNITRTTGNGSFYGYYFGSNVSGEFKSGEISNISSTSSSGDIYGIYCGNTNQKVSYTRIEKITGPAKVYGIYSGQTGTVVSNNILSRYNATGAGAAVYGIYFTQSSDVPVASNNIISLGYDKDGNTIGNCNIYGIYLVYNGNLYFNTVSIGGTLSSGTASTYAYFASSNNYTRNVKNNIFSNSRSNSGGTGVHYALSLPGVGSAVYDYNDYSSTGTGGVLGVIQGLSKTTIVLWRTATGQDANSVSTPPLFVNVTSLQPLDYLAGAYLPGTPIAGITTDYIDYTRSAAYPTQGALESNYWVGTTSTDFGTASNWMSGQVPPAGSSVIFVNSPANHCLLDQNRSIQTYSNRQSAYILKTNGHTLTLNGTNELSNGALMDAQNGTLELGGTSSVNFDYTQYVSGTVNNMIINKTGGATVTAAASAILSGTLTMTNGLFILGNYNLTAADFSGGSASSYVKTSGSGQLKSTIGNGITRNFPVGNTAYDPVLLTNNTGSADLFGASVNTEVYQNSTDGALISFSHVTRTWDISKQNPNGGAGIDITLNWNAGETSGLIVAPVLFHYGNSWQEQNGSFSSTATSFTFNGYTGSFSPFAVAEFPYALPVSWMDISAQKQGGNVQLGWSTAYEHGNASFTVQHSTDRFAWNSIGTVAGKGNTTSINKYAFIHVMPDPGMHYYRIAQNDLNGDQHYSKVVAVSMEASKRLAVYPNPVIGNSLQFDLPAASRVRFVNQTGVVVWEKNLPAGTHAVQLPQLARGYYVLVTETDKVPVILK